MGICVGTKSVEVLEAKTVKYNSILIEKESNSINQNEKEVIDSTVGSEGNRLQYNLSIKKNELKHKENCLSQMNSSLLSENNYESIDKIKLPHSQLLYVIFLIHDQGFIDDLERSKLKDLVIMSDPKMIEIIERYNETDNELNYVREILELLDN